MNDDILVPRSLLEDLISYAESATLEDDELPPCVVEASMLLRVIDDGEGN